MKALRFLFRARLFSPGGLLLRAAILAGLFLAVHAAGLRPYTSCISATSATGNPPDALTVTLGISYAVLWIFFVAIAPVLALGGTIFLGLVLAGGRRDEGP